MIRNLLLGSSGHDVKAVQDALNARRRRDVPMLVPDGAFGSHTLDAIVAFVNITMDNNDRLPIIGQAGVAGGWDVANERGEIGPQAAIVGSWSF
jgi:hypothetical protein